MSIRALFRLVPIWAAIGLSSAALAQQPAPVRAPAGNDTEVPCDALTSYGLAQDPAAVAAALAGPGVRVVPGAPTPGSNVVAAQRLKGPRVVAIPNAPMLAYAPAPAPAPPLGTRFAGIASIGLLSNGHLIVFQRRQANELLEYDASNRLLRTFDENIATRPHSLRIDRNDNIWIVDVTCNTVTKLDDAGRVLMTLGTKGKAGTWDERTGARLFNEPTDLGFGPTGDIFVATGHGGPDPRIVRFDRNGKFIKSWSLRHADGTDATIHSIVVDRKGMVYAGDREAELIHVFTADGRFVRDIKVSNLVCGLYIDSKGRLWMTAGTEGMIMRLDWTGRVVEWTGKAGHGGPNQYGEAHYMVMTPDLETIYVADTGNAYLTKLQAVH